MGDNGMSVTMPTIMRYKSHCDGCGTTVNSPIDYQDECPICKLKTLKENSSIEIMALGIKAIYDAIYGGPK